MKAILIKLFFISSVCLFTTANASTLYDDSINRGINETCSTYLDQIERSYGINGLNITFAHPEKPSQLPSLHIASQKFNNGSSFFSATLSPDEDFCYVSSILVTSVNNQSCLDITRIKTETNPDLKVMTYSDGGYTILTPPDQSYQVILTSSGNAGCTMSEIRMLWPGR